jgi:thioredoxin-dependent peroxiredoxin
MTRLRAGNGEMTMSLDVGDHVPDFALPTDDGGTLSSVNLQGKTTVLYFYPRDDTPGCTMEAQAFRDALGDFTSAGVTLVGISADDADSHRKFKSKHGLNFMLASDTDAKLAQALGVWVEKNMYGKKSMGMERATFLIDYDGVIRKVWRKVKVPGHALEVLDEARRLAAAEGTTLV